MPRVVRLVLGFTAVNLMCAGCSIESEHNLSSKGRSPSTSSAVPAPLDADLYEEVLSVTDAVPHEGSWFVLDKVGTQLHRIDPQAASIKTFGRRGLGPGELRLPESLAIRGDTLVVAETLGGVVHLFSLEGRFLGRRTAFVRSPCPVTGTFGVESLEAGLVFLVVCLSGSFSHSAFAMLVDDSGASRMLARTGALRSEASGGPVSPYFVPILAAHGAEVIFGQATHECLGTFSIRGDSTGSICHRWMPDLAMRPQDLAELDTWKNRLSSLGRDLRIPASRPSFDRLFISRGRLLYRAFDPTQDRAYRLLDDLAMDNGAPLFMSASAAFAGTGSALLAWDDIGGTRISIRALEPH